MRLAVWLLLVVLGACPTSVPAATMAPWSWDEAQPEEESPLKRRDLPPEGVEQLFSFTATFLTAPRCPTEPQPSVITQDPIEVGSRATLRFCGFVANQDVDIQVSLPNGMVVLRQVRSDT